MSKRKNNKYTVEFQQSSAKLAADSEQSVAQTARDLGLSVNTLHGWVNKYYPNHMSTKPNVNVDQDFHTQLKQLKKENSRLKQERDILKKASAYFASEIL
mgnify:FL=1